jgi:hypothetical protein
MKVYVLPGDAWGCGHYRLIWPANVLQKQGHDVVILPPDEKTGLMAKIREDEGGKSLASVAIPEDADVLVIQRPAHPLQPQMIQMIRANGVALVVDMDDDMSSIHPGNVAFHRYRTKSSTPYSWKHAEESCKAATMVTTSTKALQRTYAKHGRGRVLDNYIPAAYLSMPKEPTGCFGWAGTTKSHPNDLQITGRVVQELMDDGYPFRVVGGRSQVKECLRLRDDPQCTGSVELINWAQRIADTFDVGMVPLAPTSFNTAKSRLKGIEYMAVGIPWVSSPREEYRKLHRESGCGLLADTPKQWKAHLKQLLDDETLRQEQIEAGKAFMVDQTYQAQAWRWLEAWEEALKIERG